MVRTVRRVTTVAVGISLPIAFADALNAMATRERRTRSAMVRVLLQDAILERSRKEASSNEFH
jgi:metal-responsive CopG/Arc/MetJ family transcriptional regulator